MIDKVTCGERSAHCRECSQAPHSRCDILHAFNQPIFIEDLDEGIVMLVGPDRARNLLEIGVVVALDNPLIVHAMGARPEYLR